MITADILMWFLLIVGLLIVFNSYWVAAVGLFPGFVRRARGAYERPVRALVTGAVTAVPILVFGIVLASQNSPVLKLAGLTIIALPILIGLLGSAGLAERIGVGMPSPRDEGQGWRRVLRGGTVLSLCFLLPFIGWIGVMPLTLISGFGAAVRSVRRRASDPEPGLGAEPVPASLAGSPDRDPLRL